MGDETLNGLAEARSAYLRLARRQPVMWREWGAEAFAEAKRQDKPVLLDIGAVWCHWCHVMDRESYEDGETARLINEHFVAVKVDRDERPDVDARYQAAVAAISGQGGWPLTAFLTPDGRPFFGGTYFPPVDGHGRPSLRRVLMTMAEAFERRRDEVDDSAGSVMAAIEENESFGGERELGPELVGKIVAGILQQFDPRFGGFGSQPKFPHAAAVDLLIDEAGRALAEPNHRDEAARNGTQSVSAKRAAVVTLEKMSKGGVYDHLAGGFHRYSVDERWVVPHFEKMSYDNSELLKNYVHAYQSFSEPECARVARDIMRWVDEWLSDRERGGFYGSQDADVSLDDDGDYFTWTQAEAAAVLTAEEMTVVGPFFDVGELGDMQHNPAKNTLHVNDSLGVVAQRLGTSAEVTARLVTSAKAKMYAARKLRPAPYVDRTVYVGWNGMMVSAYLEAGRVLRDKAAAAFGLKTLDRVLEVAWDGERMGHVVSYGEALGGPAHDNLASGSAIMGHPGGLDDYVFTGHAALDAWEATGEMHYFEAAQAIGEAAVARFYDEANGGFFDTELMQVGEVRLGALGARRKPLQDSPTPAGNPVGAALLLRLVERNGNNELRDKAKKTLECFAGVAEHLGLYAGSFGLALRRLISPGVQVVVVGADRTADELERAALTGYKVNKSVVRLREVGALPLSLAKTIPHLPRQDGSFAVVCWGFSCGLPVRSVEGLRVLMLGAS